MRPLRLNADSSAISRMLPQRGHLGRRKLWAAGSGGLQASCKVIVDSPRRSHTPRLSRCCYHAWSLWRCHDAIMKLSWPGWAIFGGYNNGGGRICIKLRSAPGFSSTWKSTDATLSRGLTQDRPAPAASTVRWARHGRIAALQHGAPSHHRRAGAGFAIVHSAACARTCC